MFPSLALIAGTQSPPLLLSPKGCVMLPHSVSQISLPSPGRGCDPLDPQGNTAQKHSEQLFATHVEDCI